jgi:phosphoribosylaminoimidazolecarboxamide formyltransferase / IMP cyclohydrolase
MSKTIKRALISVSDKTGLVDFVKFLVQSGVEIISTGGTAKAIREAGLPCVEISDFTGFPEMLDGRVKTLHPKVHGGLLYVRGNAAHEATVAEHGIKPIDLVVVNLYPFEQTVAKPNVKLAEAIENIDIGGPSMLRSAAKNWEAVTVVTEPNHYSTVMENMRANEGATTRLLRYQLAVEVFKRTAFYDGAIGNHLSGRQAEVQ